MEVIMVREKLNYSLEMKLEMPGKHFLGDSWLFTHSGLPCQGNGVRLVAGSAESAALRLRAPLQQVQAQLSSPQNISLWILTALTLQTLR